MEMDICQLFSPVERRRRAGAMRWLKAFYQNEEGGFEDSRDFMDYLRDYKLDTEKKVLKHFKQFGYEKEKNSTL